MCEKEGALMQEPLKKNKRRVFQTPEPMAAEELLNCSLKTHLCQIPEAQVSSPTPAPFAVRSPPFQKATSQNQTSAK